MDAKQRAAQAAIEEIKSGMTLGLGTGSTADYFLRALGEALQQNRLRDLRGVPTSQKTADRAAEFNIPIIDLDGNTKIDLTIDGADEVDPNLNLIKGLGGALLREKVVAQNSKRVVIIADASKRVTVLGSHVPLPVEVVPFGHKSHEEFLRSLGCVPTLRKNADFSPLITDSGNFIFDCRFKQIDDAAKLQSQLRTRAGIVECGLFLNIAHTAIIGYDDRVEILTR